uniref:Uncharacterized protein n=1 Tax=Caedibacter taeniospiralis TaxID=28907 RepID=Q6TFF1_CAETA|nr:hypothetical protein [Caedibacter taeniospiralis]
MRPEAPYQKSKIKNQKSQITIISQDVKELFCSLLWSVQSMKKESQK